jgi:oxygen-dependent protoporphyrinogen oxidase
MGQLIDALADGFGKSLKCDHATNSVGRTGSRFEISGPGGSMRADSVVLAVPAYRAARMLSGILPGIAGPLEEIPYCGLWVVCLGFDRSAVPHLLDGYGFLIPRRDKRRILGCLWSSSIFPGRAPSGEVLLRVMAGGSRNPEIARLSESKIVQTIREEMHDMLGISAEPKLVKAIHHERAIPQYTIGHALRLAAIDKAAEEVPGLFLTGNAYRGVAMADCILQAGKTAETVVEFIGE